MSNTVIDMRVSRHRARRGDLYRIGSKQEGKPMRWSKPLGKDVAERMINWADFGLKMLRPVTAPVVDLRAQRVKKSSLAPRQPVVDFSHGFAFLERPARIRTPPRRTASGQIRRRGVWQKPPSNYISVESPEHEYKWNRKHTYGQSRINGGKTLAEIREKQRRAAKYYPKTVIVQLGKPAPGRTNYVLYAPRADVQARAAEWRQ